MNVASFANNDKPKQPPNVREQERTLRENLARSGVASSLVKERKLSRQLARSGRKGTITQFKKRRKTASGSKEDEFLLDAYHSDEEAQGNVSSDSNDDEIALSDLARSDAKKQGDKNSKRTPLTSKALLEGTNLDGSGYQNDPERNSRYNNNWDESARNKLASVGAVKPGSGLRKIVYAARTHSQLSQFISELRRTHWGKDVKVVALGSRSLLCSNEDVLYSSKKNKKSSRRSEAEVTEMCLDMQKNKRDGGVKRTIDGSGKAKKAKQKSSCPYRSSSEAISTLAMHSLVRPSDIEDMGLSSEARCFNQVWSY